MPQDHLAALAAVWEIHRERVIKRMLEIWRSEAGSVLSSRSRERLILELAQLCVWLEERVVVKNTENRPIDQLDPSLERVALDSAHIRERIENTARILADHTWGPLVARERARHPLLVSDSAGQANRRPGKIIKPGARPIVAKQHYSPAFANRYWADEASLQIRVYSRGIDQRIHSRDVGHKSWGRARSLYSQALEAQFGLFEGDAKTSYTKLLNTIPLTEDDRRTWIAFLIAQRFRTPRAIRAHLVGLKRIILRDGINYSTHIADLRAAYETLFSNKEVFAHFYRLITGRAWHIWRASPGGYFLRSDEPVLIAASLERKEWQLLYSLTPRQCFVVGPDRPPQGVAARIVPSTRELSSLETTELNRRVARSARLSAIGPPVVDDQSVRELLNTVLGEFDETAIDLEQSLLSYWSPA